MNFIEYWEIDGSGQQLLLLKSALKDKLSTSMSYFFLIFALLLMPFFSQAKETILVSIAPQKFLVEKIAQDTVLVEVVVPPGVSPHSYEPTPSQTILLQKGTLWFQIGEGFEYKLSPALRNIEKIDQREGIDLIGSNCGCHSCYSFCDVHIWLSPKNLEIMASQIEKKLIKSFPEHRSLYRKNLKDVQRELSELDHSVSVILTPIKGKSVLVSHPAFAYFCRDYGLNQLSIEMEGKEPTAKYLSELFHWAKKENIRTVFLQKQYNVKGGKKLAHDLNANVIFLDPYAENVTENIETIAKAFLHT